MRDAATVLIVRDAPGVGVRDAPGVGVRDAPGVGVADSPDLEVLMVQRASRLAFAANAWVFPGGRVDRDDAANAARIGTGLTDGEASAMLGVASGGLAWWFAAIRETLEEVGLLLGASAVPAEPGGPPEPGPEVGLMAELRAVLHRQGGEGFAQLLERHGITLDLSGLHEVARFVTPLGPSRRFDTRFFLAQAPAGQSPEHDESEIVAARWMRPGDAIGAWRSGELELMAVTHRMLACLDRFGSAAEAVGRVAGRPEPARLRVDDPEGDYTVYLPGEPGYESAELQVEHGAIRLWPADPSQRPV